MISIIAASATAMAAAMMVISTECVPTKTPPTPASTPLTRVRIVPAPGRCGEGGLVGDGGTATASSMGKSLRPGGTGWCVSKLKSARTTAREDWFRSGWRGSNGEMGAAASARVAAVLEIGPLEAARGGRCRGAGRAVAGGLM